MSCCSKVGAGHRHMPDHRWIMICLHVMQGTGWQPTYRQPPSSMEHSDQLEISVSSGSYFLSIFRFFGHQWIMYFWLVMQVPVRQPAYRQPPSSMEHSDKLEFTVSSCPSAISDRIDHSFCVHVLCCADGHYFRSTWCLSTALVRTRLATTPHSKQGTFTHALSVYMYI